MDWRQEVDWGQALTGRPRLETPKIVDDSLGETEISADRWHTVKIDPP